MTCENCAPEPKRTPWRIRFSYASTKQSPLWTVFRYDETHHGAGHSGYFAVISKPTWEEACEYVRVVT
jgi:hypothetical protein